MYQYVIRGQPVIGGLFAPTTINSSPPGENGRHFADDIFRHISRLKSFVFCKKKSLKFIRKVPIDNNPAVVLIMACRGIGDKPLSEQMLTPFINSYMRH